MPYDFKDGTHIRSLIRSGSLNYEALVEALETEGVIDDRHDELSHVTRPTFNSFNSDEFNELHRFFCPGRTHPMEVQSLGVQVARGEFVYALYDAAKIEAAKVIETLQLKYGPKP
jgi:hypothetical protein